MSRDSRKRQSNQEKKTKEEIAGLIHSSIDSEQVVVVDSELISGVLEGTSDRKSEKMVKQITTHAKKTSKRLRKIRGLLRKLG